ncbi:MAG: hypothetical protein WC711_00770 [Candidatus Staskawiczbacteria bacterium]|jgi:hypothetical protein
MRTIKFSHAVRGNLDVASAADAINEIAEKLNITIVSEGASYNEETGEIDIKVKIDTSSGEVHKFESTLREAIDNLAQVDESAIPAA